MWTKVNEYFESLNSTIVWAFSDRWGSVSIVTQKKTQTKKWGWGLKWPLTFFWWQRPAPRGCLWLPTPRSHRCYFPHLQNQRAWFKSATTGFLRVCSGSCVFISQSHWRYILCNVWCWVFVSVSQSLSKLTLHLDQKLCLDAACSFTFVLVPGAAQWVHLINEDDGGFVLASQVE